MDQSFAVRKDGELNMLCETEEGDVLHVGVPTAPLYTVFRNITSMLSQDLTVLKWV